MKKQTMSANLQTSISVTLLCTLSLINMPAQNGQGAQHQQRPILRILLPILEYLIQKVMDRRRQHQSAAQAPASPQQENPFATPPTSQRRRKRTKVDNNSRTPPSWKDHYSSHPHHYVRDFAAYALPHALRTIANTPPMKKPKRKNIWLFGYKDFIVDYTQYELDRQLRLGLPDLEAERIYPRTTERVDGSLLKADRFFNYAEQMIKHEIEKEIRKYVRRQIEEQGAPPAFPQPTGYIEHEEEDEQPMASGGLRPATPPSAPNVPVLRWADLNPEQREFLAHALSTRLGRIIAQSAGDILARVDEENGTLWGIGHDDLIQKTVNRDFNLATVRQDPGPQVHTDNGTLGRGPFSTPQSTQGRFGLASRPESSVSATLMQPTWPPQPVSPQLETPPPQHQQSPHSSSGATEQTLWPTNERYADVWGTPTPQPGPQRQTKEKTNPKPAESSLGTMFRSLSLRHKKEDSNLRKKRTFQQSDKNSDTQKLLSTPRPSEDHSLMDQTQALPGRSASMRRSHHTSQSSALRHGPSPHGKRAESERPGPPKHGHAEPERGTPTKQSHGTISRIGRSLSIRGTGSKRESRKSTDQRPTGEGPPVSMNNSKAAGSGLTRTASQRRSSKDKHKEVDQVILPDQPISSVGVPPPSGTRYDDMREATPPEIQDPIHTTQTLPRGRISVDSQRLVDNATAAGQFSQQPMLSPVQEVTSPVDLGIDLTGQPLNQPAVQSHGGHIGTGPRVAAAHNALQAAASGAATGTSGRLFADQQQPRRPSGGRLAEAAAQNPASASAPPKRSIGSNLLDRLEAEKRARAAAEALAQTKEPSPGPPVRNPSRLIKSPASTNAPSSAGVVSQTPQPVAYQPGQPQLVQINPPLGHIHPALRDQYRAQTQNNTPQAASEAQARPTPNTPPPPSQRQPHLIPSASQYSPSVYSSAPSASTTKIHNTNNNLQGGPSQVHVPSPLFSRKNSVRNQDQTNVRSQQPPTFNPTPATHTEPRTPEQKDQGVERTSPVSPYVSDAGHSSPLDGKGKGRAPVLGEEGEGGKWAWPKYIPGGSPTRKSANKGKGKQDDGGKSKGKEVRRGPFSAFGLGRRK